MVLIQIKHGITPLHTAALNNNNSRVNNMDRSTYPLLSEKEFVEIARRILAGEYNYQNGFDRDLADFLLTGGDSAMTQKQLHTRGVFLNSEHHLIECIITWQSLKGISGLRQEWLH